jgi:hypothetical protein
MVYSDWPQQTKYLEKISIDEIRLVLTGDGIVGEGRLGTNRSLLEYGKYAGLDFINGEIIDNYYEF